MFDVLAQLLESVTALQSTQREDGQSARLGFILEHTDGGAAGKLIEWVRRAPIERGRVGRVERKSFIPVCRVSGG